MRNPNYTKSFGLVLILLLFSAIVSFFPSLNSIALYGALPLALVISLAKLNDFRTREIIGNKYIRLFVILYLWIAFSSLYAEYQPEAQQVMHEILGVILLMVVVVINGNTKENFPWLYVVYLFFYIGMFIYARYNIFPEIALGVQRLDDKQLNANTVAYYTFYLTFAIFIISECASKKFYIRLFRLLFLATIPLTVFVAIATASRQVLIIQVPLIALLLYIRYMKDSKRSKILFIMVAILAVALSVGYVSRLYEGSYLQERNSYSIEDDDRTLLLKDAIKVGTEHFFTGVGTGNYVRYSYIAHFSHCTYTELFANNGIFAALIYTFIVFDLMIKQWRRYKKSKDKLFLVFAAFFFIFIVDNIFYVFYNSIWLMGFFTIVMVHSEWYYKYQSNNLLVNNR